MIALATFTCLAIALHDVDGPIHCKGGQKVRLQGIGATEMDGSCRQNQPCVAGDPRKQRRTMARIMGAKPASEDTSINGQLWFARPVRLTCTATGKSHKRVTAWCQTAAGKDLSCEAIKARVAVRWDKYDRGGNLRRCAG
ncbi:hypothetical protein [Sphingomonas sp. KC8]|uniref:hypothetical protein n=1 Tax=Sphingomonas sp. KC8 TaxID=1030157 RepID=UPI0002489391|nr:hypothetical protein [Sphingomonas sp. KC8]ARS29048.1 hypothetical protein KC8_17400 [Sphingomonas sp. KC8]